MKKPRRLVILGISFLWSFLVWLYYWFIDNVLPYKNCPKYFPYFSLFVSVLPLSQTESATLNSSKH